MAYAYCVYCVSGSTCFVDCFRNSVPVLTIYIRRDEHWYAGKIHFFVLPLLLLLIQFELEFVSIFTTIMKFYVTTEYIGPYQYGPKQKPGLSRNPRSSSNPQNFFYLKMVSFGAFGVVFYVIQSYKRVNKRPGIDPANQRVPGQTRVTRPHFKPCYYYYYHYDYYYNHNCDYPLLLAQPLIFHRSFLIGPDTQKVSIRTSFRDADARFLPARCLFLSPSQQCQSIEGYTVFVVIYAVCFPPPAYSAVCPHAVCPPFIHASCILLG